MPRIISKFLFFIMTVIGAAVLMGARDCDISLSTDGSSYIVGGEGLATLRNDTSAKIFLPGCELFTFERLEEGRWVGEEPSVTCIWEGLARPVSPGEALTAPFAAPRTGTWRLSSRVGIDCLSGQPLSKARCSLLHTVTSEPFEVVVSDEVCEDLGGVEFGRCKMLLGWAVVSGTCQPVGGCGPQSRTFASSELDCLSSCITDCSQWDAVVGLQLARVSACSTADDCRVVRGTAPSGCSRDLVARGDADLTDFWSYFRGREAAGCGGSADVGCPSQAERVACLEGRCQWSLHLGDLPGPLR